MRKSPGEAKPGKAMRRIHLRPHPKILKRLLIQVGAFNLRAGCRRHSWEETRVAPVFYGYPGPFTAYKWGEQVLGRVE